MNTAQDSQGVPLVPANAALDIAVYVGKTVWIVPMVLVRQSNGQTELKQTVHAPDADDEFAARGMAVMAALNANPGFCLFTITCVRVAAAPSES
jgi:hypothetical protein